MEELKQYTDDEILDTLDRIIDERPDYIYQAPPHNDVLGTEACFYTTPEGDASCLMGYLLLTLWPELKDDLVAIEWNGVEDGEIPNSLSIKSLISDLQLPISRNVADGLAFGQGQQDTGRAWGDCRPERP